MKKLATILTLLLAATILTLSACDSGGETKYAINFKADGVEETYTNNELFGFYVDSVSDETWSCTWWKGDAELTITLPVTPSEDPPLRTGSVFLEGDDNFDFKYDTGNYEVFRIVSTEAFYLTITNWSETVGDIITGTFYGTLEDLLTEETVEITEGSFECIMTGLDEMDKK